MLCYYQDQVSGRVLTEAKAPKAEKLLKKV